MKKNIILFIIILIFIAVPLTTSAFSVEYVQQYNYSYNEAGFLSGIWHGLIAPYSLFVRWLSPFGSEFNVDMYAYTNTGWFYDLGFLLGVPMSVPIGWLAAIVAFIALLI